MAQLSIKTSFASGEWAPKLRSRVDVQKYHSGAALLRNFYVDYSGGGASTRQGTKFINQCKAASARVIPFQPSSTLSYVLEFGQNYIRFYSNGAPVLEAATAITGVTQANPGVVTDVAHGYVTGDWIYILSVGGMTQLNGNYYIVIRTGANTYTLTDLNGNAIDTTGFGAYTSGGTAQRVYTITTPYNASDLFPNPAMQNPGIKWVQDVTSLIICHPSYPASILTINSATNWSFTSITIGPTIPAPGGLNGTGSSMAAGSWNYAYLVTSVDANGQESGPSTPIVYASLSYIGVTQGLIQTNWTGVPGAQSYNVYKTLPTFTTAIVAGAQYGFIGNVTGTSIQDSYPGITPDFGQTPPIVGNPFVGPGVNSYITTANGAYTVVPSVSVAAPTSGVRATAYASLGVTVVGAITHSFGNADILTTSADPNGSQLTFPGGVVLTITSTTLIGSGPGTSKAWEINTVSLTNPGSITGPGNTTPGNPVPATGCNFSGFIQFGAAPAFAVTFTTWGVTQTLPIIVGSGYTAVPAVTFSAGAATATAQIGPLSGGNPGVPGFIQERLALAGQAQAVQSFNFSQPFSFFNFNTSNPSQPDDAISGAIISEELNDIRWLTPVPTGILAGTGKSAWLINGGGGISTQVPITPSNVTAQPQAFNGANDLRPLKINFDVLYATNKGNYVRDLSYNLYAQIFTGSDISVLSNHLFFGFSLADWCWAEEPFKTAWVVRSDGQMLSLGYVKEQELIGWAHHDTNGQFKSVCSVIETVNGNVVDAVYVVVQRVVNSNVVSYVERMADRYFPYSYEDAWSVDCALQTIPIYSGNASVPSQNNGFNGAALTVSASIGIATFTFSQSLGLSGGNVGNIIRVGGGVAVITAVTSGGICTCNITRAITASNPYTGAPFPSTTDWTLWIPTATVTGLTQLIGQSVVGVADGVAVGPFIVSASGSVALGLTATKITLGMAFLPQLQTLPLDLGEPTVQGKRKKIVGVTLRVADTLGLQIGTSFANAVVMKDFTIGNVGTQSNQIVTGLVNGDGRTIIDQAWQEAGSYCIQQTLPYPATVLGAMPEVTVGDTK